MSDITRRVFLGKASATGAVLAASSLLAKGSDSTGNRFAYDVSRFSFTDPKLISYEEQRRFKKIAERPRRLWANPNGSFLVACEKGALEFSMDGLRGAEFLTASPGRCVARHGDGTTYVGTKTGIFLFSKNGKEAGFWPVPDFKCWITALDISNEYVFAADSGNRVVLRYDRAGKLSGRIGTKDKKRNVPGIILPSPYLDVRLGSDGLLRVNNTGRHEVEVYTAEGDLEVTWGKPGNGVEKFAGCCNPVAIDVLPGDKYVTCEKGLPRVKVYGANGDFESVIAGPESFPENSKHGAARDPVDGTMGGLDAAVTASGSVLILDLVTADVRLMRPKTK